MAIFNMSNQHVNYQYNAENINFGAVQNRLDLVGELEKLQTEVTQAKLARIFDKEGAIDAEYEVKEAVQEAKKPQPDKRTVSDHLNRAKTAIEGVAAAGGLVTALVKAAELVQKFFSRSGPRISSYVGGDLERWRSTINVSSKSTPNIMPKRLSFSNKSPTAFRCCPQTMPRASVGSWMNI
jgi:arginine repressor